MIWDVTVVDRTHSGLFCRLIICCSPGQEGKESRMSNVLLWLIIIVYSSFSPRRLVAMKIKLFSLVRQVYQIKNSVFILTEIFVWFLHFQIFFLLFILLYVSSYFGLCRFKRKEKDEWNSGIAYTMAYVYDTSFFCSFILLKVFQPPDYFLYGIILFALIIDVCNICRVICDIFWLQAMRMKPQFIEYRRLNLHYLIGCKVFFFMLIFPRCSSKIVDLYLLNGCVCGCCTPTSNLNC